MIVNQVFKNLIQPLTKEEFNQLERNCLEYGIRDAIVLWNNVIIDGHNRYAIATKHNLRFNTVEMKFADETEVKRWIILNQFGRRNLNNFQRAELSLQVKDYFSDLAKERMLTGKKSSDPAQNSAEGCETREIIAKLAGVSHDTVRRVERVLQIADKNVLADARNGKMSVNQAYKQSTLIAKEEERLELSKRYNNIILTDKQIDLRFGDFNLVLDDIPDNSLDMILTDPAYESHYLYTWKELSKFASKKLKPGGFCVALSGQFHLPQVMNMMAENLQYYWLGALVHEGDYVAKRKEVNFVNKVKPILFYHKPPKIKQENWADDMFLSIHPDKQYHEWGQSLNFFIQILNIFKPKVVCDPFSGGGTVAEACKELSINFIGAEIDEANFNIAKARLENVFSETL
ncbi:MAG: hypothetical protein EOO89_00355 [Pedobacter sp.]|nr:MAG: hypothetical protein EOO89_00355 [Pedobacter sp.]